MKLERWQQIERLYHAALERAESERAAFLKEACTGDDALRQEVESLLAQHAKLPFHTQFRANWVDNGTAMIVNRQNTVSHIVLFDHFWEREGQ